MEAIRAEMEAIRVRTKVIRDERKKANKDTREEAMACQEKTEARLLREEPSSRDMEPEVSHEEVPVDDATVMPVGEPRNRRRDQQNMSAERRKKKKDVAARRGTTRRAQVARRNLLFAK
jgi:hypothetical protein